MKKELKRQIREDELRSWMEHAAAWLQANQRQAGLVAAAIVLVVAGAWGVRFYQERRDRDAQAAFAEAMDVYLTPLQAETPEGAGSTGKPFATLGEKLTKAIAAFDGVDRRFAGTPSARRARYFAAVARIEAGDTAQAETALQELAKGQGTLEAGLANLALGDLYRRTGQTDKAVAVLRLVVETRDAAVPRDAALMSLAEAQQEAGRLAEARASFERLAQDFPTSVFAAEARRRAEFLETAAG